jgi:hypothetical protein
MGQELENQVETQNNELLTFDWEGNETENFFGVEPEKSEVQKIVEEIKKNEPTPQDNKVTQKKSKEEVQGEEEDDFFEVEEKITKQDEAQEDALQEEGGIYKDVYNDLKEHGIFKHVELEEGEEIDADKLFELQEEEYETEVSERLKAWASEELDDDAKAFIKFKREGGNTADFFSVYKSSSDVPTGTIEDEDYQDEVIRYQLKQEGWDRDEIEDRLAYLTDNGKKEKVAEKYDVKIKQEEDKKKQTLLKQAEQQKLVSKEQEETFKSNVKETLESVDEVSGFKITLQDKQKILNFLTKKEHKISDTRAITGFQKKLAEVFQDTNKMVLLAKLVESDFDMSDFEKQVTTKKTKQVKSNLEQRKGMRPSNSGSSLKGSNLADLFN